MPAYSFQPQFVDPIRAGTKGGTIRLTRKIPLNANHHRFEVGGHAFVGEELALYCRQRSPAGFLITRRRCVAVERIRLNFLESSVVFERAAVVLTGRSFRGATADEFARFDGFSDWAELVAFWRKTHGDIEIFAGWHIRWADLPVPA